MHDQLNPAQVLVLWNLLFTGEEPMISRLRPALTPADRRDLEKRGLVRLEKRGRALHLVLTEKAWGWAADNLTAGFSPSRFAAETLAGVLRALKHHVDQKTISLTDLLAPIHDGRSPGPESQDMISRIRKAYLEAAGGTGGVRVRLADLAARLNDVPKEIIDRELKRMQMEGAYGLVLWPLDDPLDVSADDEAAAIDVAGARRHIVYMEA